MYDKINNDIIIGKDSIFGGFSHKGPVLRETCLSHGTIITKQMKKFTGILLTGCHTRYYVIIGFYICLHLSVRIAS